MSRGQKANVKAKLIVILGPTAVGKSDLAMKIAKKFQGEIVSADSRQVYQGMDIGTGKVLKDKSKVKRQKSKLQVKSQKIYFHKGIRHYLLNVASPKRIFTVVQYKRLALQAIKDIQQSGKVPILCGGTGFYIQAVIDGITIPEVPPDWKLRKELEKKSVEELYQILKKLDQKRAKTIERKNPRRIIRAIEIVLKTGKPVPQPLPRLRQDFGGQAYPVLILGIKKEKKELNSLIRKRFFQWLEKGFLKEVLKLRKMGLSWKRIEDFGIHYKKAAQYLKKEISEQEFIEKSIIELQNYAKRQMTWFKRDKKIHWVKNYDKAEKLVKEFLRK